MMMMNIIESELQHIKFTKVRLLGVPVYGDVG